MILFINHEKNISNILAHPKTTWFDNFLEIRDYTQVSHLINYSGYPVLIDERGDDYVPPYDTTFSYNLRQLLHHDVTIFVRNELGPEALTHYYPEFTSDCLDLRIPN